MGKTNPKYFKQIMEYNKANYQRFCLRLRKDSESELIEYLNSKDSINDFLKNLVKETYEKGR